MGERTRKQYRRLAPGGICTESENTSAGLAAFGRAPE